MYIGGKTNSFLRHKLLFIISFLVVHCTVVYFAAQLMRIVVAFSYRTKSETAF